MKTFVNGRRYHLNLPNGVIIVVSKLEASSSLTCQYEWQPGKIVDEIKSSSYQVQNTDGAFYRRNRTHIRPTNVNVHIRDATRLPTPQCQQRQLIPKPRKSVETILEPIVSAPVVDSRPTQASKQQSVSSRPKRDVKEPAYLKDYIRH